MFVLYGIELGVYTTSYEGEPKEELYDAILEVAAFARTQLIKTSSFQNKIPS